MVNTYPALFWGYLVLWGILVVYMVLLGRRVNRIERRLLSKDEP